MVCARPHRNLGILSLEEKTKEKENLSCRSGCVTYDTYIPLLEPQRHTWKDLHKVSTLPKVVILRQHFVHALTKICCRLICHKKILTQIF
jgi:hypothetical protein